MERIIKKRNEVYIRITDIPPSLFKAITKKAFKNRRSNGKEVLTYLEQTNYEKSK